MIISFLLFVIVFPHQCLTFKCSVNRTKSFHQTYLCREKVDSSTIRIWLHPKDDAREMKKNFFSLYRLTLRTIDLVDNNKILLEDRMERSITDFTSFDSDQNENHTIILKHLYPGRYEICVNFYNEQRTIFFRSLYSCIQVPWFVPDHELDRPNLLIQVSLLISIIVLFASIVFVFYAIHQFLKSRRIPNVEVAIEEDQPMEEVDHNTLRAYNMINEHFARSTRPIELLVMRRYRQRYSDRSPDLE